MPEEDRLPQTVQKTGRYLPDFANAELMEQVLTERELKARQSSKIREIGEALITAGFVSLNAQAKVFGLPRSTAWAILSANRRSPNLTHIRLHGCDNHHRFAVLLGSGGSFADGTHVLQQTIF